MKTKNNAFFSKPFVVACFALLCCALGGSATPFIKMGYELILPEKDTASTILFAGIRFLLAGFITVAIYSIVRRRALIPKRENVGRIALVCLFQTVLQYIFFYVGLANTSGVKGTVLSGSTAFFALLISSLILKQEKLTTRKIIACILGFSGIVIVNLKGLDFNMNFFGDVFVIFSSIASAASAAIVKKFSDREDPVVMSGYQFMAGGIVMIGIGLVFGGAVKFDSWAAVGVIAYLAALSAIAFSLWGLLLKYNPVSKVTIYSFMIPMFGVLLSELILTEDSDVSYVNLALTLILVCSGIVLINYRKENQA